MSLLNNLKSWLGRPIEIRANETIDAKIDYYHSFEQKIKEQVLALLEREGTEIFWLSESTDVIIRNKNIGCRILITLSKQRVMWESLQSTDTIPTTQSFIESLFEDIKKYQDKLFGVLCEDILNKRQSRLSDMTIEISKTNILDISSIV